MKATFKKVMSFALAVAMMASLVACGAATPSTPDESSSQNNAEQYDLVYATNATGTGNYTVAAAQGSIVTSKTGNVNVTVMATSGPEGIVAAIKGESAQIGILSAPNMRMQYGEGCDEAMRTMFCGGYTMFSFVTKDDSGIKTVEDLRGKRVTYLSNNVTFQKAAIAILEGNNIDPEKDVQALSMMDASAGLQDLVDGKTDAVISAISGSKMEELASKITPYVLPVSNNEACSEASGGFFAAVEANKEFKGIVLGQPMLASVSQVNCTKDTPAEAIYAFVKTCMENYDELAAVGSDLKDWTPEAAVKTYAGFPFHEGAVTYFKEAGMWSDEMEAWQQDTLTALGAEK